MFEKTKVGIDIIPLMVKPFLFDGIPHNSEVFTQITHTYHGNEVLGRGADIWLSNLYDVRQTNEVEELCKVFVYCFC